MTDDPEVWAAILGWHCWRDATGFWHARLVGASPAAVIQAASLDALRALIDPPGQHASRPGDGRDLGKADG